MTPNRKRDRSSQEDEAEFTPLSKRINNLHINPSWMQLQQTNTQLGNINVGEWGSGPTFLPPSTTTRLPDSPPLSVQSTDWNPNTNAYNPELTETENPYYYNSNKVLFEMYMARSQRNNN